MAEEGDVQENQDGEESAGGGKKKLMMILLPLILGGVGAGLHFSGMLSGEGKKEVVESVEEKTIYFDMDEFLVNLNNPGNQVSFLKTIITLELPNQKSLNEVQSIMPRVRDTFQIYLRELRNSDLQGSAGLQRLRTELLLRLNSQLEDGRVNNILFKEIIVQ